MMYVIFLIIFDLIVCVNSNFIIYGTGFGELRIKRVKTKETLKTIKIQVDEIKGGLAIDFRNDLIFFAEGPNIYKIYLVDELGKRKISQKGELFLAKNVDHFEVLLFGGDHSIEGLFFDESSSKLFTTWNDKMHSGLYTVDTETGQIKNVFEADDCIPLRNPVIYKHFVYFTCPFYAYKRGLYKSDIGKYMRVGIKTGKEVNVTSFDIDRNTKRLFFSQRSTIRMFDTHPAKGIVVADSAVSNGVRAIAVYGKYVIWTSIKIRKIFIGELDEDMYFIPMRNIVAIDGSDKDPIHAHHVILF